MNAHWICREFSITKKTKLIIIIRKQVHRVFSFVYESLMGYCWQMCNYYIVYVIAQNVFFRRLHNCQLRIIMRKRREFSWESYWPENMFPATNLCRTIYFIADVTFEHDITVFWKFTWIFALIRSSCRAKKVRKSLCRSVSLPLSTLVSVIKSAIFWAEQFPVFVLD